MIYLDPLSVTASRLDHPFISETRDLTVIDSDQINRIPAASVTDLLQYVGVLDVQRRGIDGVQADFSLRGGSFEQVVVLVDGMRVNNPQTGHHHANIPVSLPDVERIEVMPGHGASLYGSNGVGGVIHIITKDPDKTRTRLHLRGGSFKTVAAYVSQTFSLLKTDHQLSFERNQSDGHRRETDYQINTLSYQFRTGSGQLKFDGRAGYQEKDFGANGFYADYPSHENIRAAQAYVRTEWQPFSSVFIQNRLSVNRHDDFFILDMDSPDWYQNDHTTDVYSDEIHFNIIINNNLKTVAGMELLQSQLSSSVLGHHKQTTFSLYNETVYQIDSGWLLNSGIRLDQFHDGHQVSPALGLRYTIKPGLSWRFSGGRVFRIPNFTELYYQSPANTGNPDLKPETGWALETGVTWQYPDFSASLTCFYRNETHHIDWVKENQTESWTVMNLSPLQILGMSTWIFWRIKSRFSLGMVYTGLSRDFNEADVLMKKYSDYALTQKIQISATAVWPGRIKQNLVLRLIQRQKVQSVLLADAKWLYPFSQWTFFIEWRNLFNQKYEELYGVSMPGSHLMAGLTRQIEW